MESTHFLRCETPLSHKIKHSPKLVARVLSYIYIEPETEGSNYETLTRQVIAYDRLSDNPFIFHRTVDTWRAELQDLTERNERVNAHADILTDGLFLKFSPQYARSFMSPGPSLKCGLDFDLLTLKPIEFFPGPRETCTQSFMFPLSKLLQPLQFLRPPVDPQSPANLSNTSDSIIFKTDHGKQLLPLECDMFCAPGLCSRIFKVAVLAYAWLDFVETGTNTNWVRSRASAPDDSPSVLMGNDVILYTLWNCL
ncbi:hypothetical protein J6590_064443 [Homalodisca vitripennis]|nr:hypothetical protein J6590_064443 [Homalodisca vitripennis]